MQNQSWNVEKLHKHKLGWNNFPTAIHHGLLPYSSFPKRIWKPLRCSYLTFWHAPPVQRLEPMMTTNGVPRVLAIRLRNPSDMGLFQWNLPTHCWPHWEITSHLWWMKLLIQSLGFSFTLSPYFRNFYLFIYLFIRVLTCNMVPMLEGN